MTWSEFRDFINFLPPTSDSALYRVRHPKSWWWTPEIDFLSALLMSIQVGNWQRGGGKGAKPEPVKRPKEKSQRRSRVKVDPVSAEDLASRRAMLKKRIEEGGG